RCIAASGADCHPPRLCAARLYPAVLRLSAGRLVAVVLELSGRTLPLGLPLVRDTRRERLQPLPHREPARYWQLGLFSSFADVGRGAACLDRLGDDPDRDGTVDRFFDPRGVCRLAAARAQSSLLYALRRVPALRPVFSLFHDLLHRGPVRSPDQLPAPDAQAIELSALRGD